MAGGEKGGGSENEGEMQTNCNWIPCFLFQWDCFEETQGLVKKGHVSRKKNPSSIQLYKLIAGQ